MEVCRNISSNIQRQTDVLWYGSLILLRNPILSLMYAAQSARIAEGLAYLHICEVVSLFPHISGVLDLEDLCV